MGGMTMPMSAMTTPGAARRTVPAPTLLAPLVIGISVTTVLILLIEAMAPTEKELREEAELDRYAATIRSRSGAGR
jgi:hypothetical protein